MQSHRIRFITKVIAASIIAQFVLLVGPSVLKRHKFDYELSKKFVKATKPKSIFRTYVTRFEADKELNLSIGFVFTPDQDPWVLYSNYRHLLQLINEPVNVFVCYKKDQKLSPDQTFLTNFGTKVTVDDFSVASCKHQFMMKYPAPNHVVVFGPHAEFVDKTLTHVQSLFKINSVHSLPVALVSNNKFVFWISSGLTMFLATFVAVLLYLLLSRVKEDIIIGMGVASSSHWKQRKVSSSLICRKSIQIAIIFMYILATVGLFYGQICGLVEELILKWSMQKNHLVVSQDPSIVGVLYHSASEVNDEMSQNSRFQLISVL